jgi:hypothetical protein
MEIAKEGKMKEKGFSRPVVLVWLTAAIVIVGAAAYLFSRNHRADKPADPVEVALAGLIRPPSGSPSKTPAKLSFLAFMDSMACMGCMGEDVFWESLNVKYGSRGLQVLMVAPEKNGWWAKEFQKAEELSFPVTTLDDRLFQTCLDSAEGINPLMLLLNGKGEILIAGEHTMGPDREAFYAEIDSICKANLK